MGSAYTNVSSHIDSANSWVEIHAALVRELSDTPDSVDLITAFHQLRQNSSSIQDYYTQFHEYLQHMKSIADTDDLNLLQCYCNRLNSEYEAFHTKQVAKM